ncbi:hypothetical protein GOBAR_DD26471 [Gossypium barbadense]|nr:hypothetical protein GOBAR_DD26471 [Gossypium barbadense]
MNIVIAKCVAASKGSSPPFWLVLKIWMLSDPFCQYPFGDLRSGDAKFRDDPRSHIRCCPPEWVALSSSSRLASLPL